MGGVLIPTLHIRDFRLCHRFTSDFGHKKTLTWRGGYNVIHTYKT
jgi:hypothetical protein